MLAYLGSLVPPDRAMFPREEPQRHRAIKVAALATGACDKVVSLFYEQRLHEQASDLWVARCRSQIRGAIAELEAARATIMTPYWFGSKIGHADIAVGVMLRFLTDVHPDLIDLAANPALGGHFWHLEALPAFKFISQIFIPPA